MRYITILLMLLLVGCSEQPATYAPNNELLAQQLKEHAENIQGVEQASIYIAEPYLVVSLELSALQRYRKKKIETSLTKYVEQMHPQFQSIISADRKLQFELGKMSFQKQNEVSKRFQELEKLLKEET